MTTPTLHGCRLETQDVEQDILFTFYFFFLITNTMTTTVTPLTSRIPPPPTPTPIPIMHPIPHATASASGIGDGEMSGTSGTSKKKIFNLWKTQQTLIKHKGNEGYQMWSRYRNVSAPTSLYVGAHFHYDVTHSHLQSVLICITQFHSTKTLMVKTYGTF